MNHFFALVGILILPGTLPAEDARIVPFPLDWDRFGDIVLSQSEWLDAPAGKEGFITVRGRFLVQPNGKRFRIWGMNLCGPHCFPTRQEANVGENAPIPQLNPHQFAKASRERFFAEAEFLIGLERSSFVGMKKFLKEELGVKSLVIGTADHNDRYAAYAHIVENARLDFIDGHGYWQHPNIGPTTVCRNDPMVNERSPGSGLIASWAW